MMCCVLTSLGKHGEGEAAAVGVPLLQDGKARRALDPRVRRDVIRDRALVGHVAERGEVLSVLDEDVVVRLGRVGERRPGIGDGVVLPSRFFRVLWVDLVAPRARTVASVTRGCKRVLLACVRSRASPIARLFGRDVEPQSLGKTGFPGR